MTTTLRVHFDGKVLVPEQPVDLPIGQSVQVRIVELHQAAPNVGSPLAVLSALHAEPHVPPTDVAELERSIRDAQLPVRQTSPFDEPGT